MDEFEKWYSENRHAVAAYFPNDEKSALEFSQIVFKAGQQSRWISVEERLDEVVALIVDDLSDRRGLGQEWEQIDAVIQHEIREAWKTLIRETLKPLPPPTGG